MYRSWRALSDGYPGDRAFVGEVWVQPGFTCVVNVGDSPAPLPAGLADALILLASVPLADGPDLPGATAVWLAAG